MNTWLSYLLVPSIMIISGFIMRYKAPRKMNHLFGYRTSMSMKSPQTWQYAHALCGKLWVIMGCIMLPISAIPMLFVMNKNAAAAEQVGEVVALIQVFFMLCSVVYVEISLRRNFDKNGERKNDWEK